MSSAWPDDRPRRLNRTIDGRQLTLSNLAKVLWPRLGLTKGWLVDYYTEIAPVLLPHVRGHPVTLHRYPDGVDGMHWYQTRAPAHPDWVETVTIAMERSKKTFDVCVLNDVASIVWAAQMGTIELHPYLGTTDALDRPSVVVFDLDPGFPATIVDCCQVATRIWAVLKDLGLSAWPKTSGWSGLHVYVPLNSPADYGQTKGFARAMAQALERDDPGLVTSRMARAKRSGKVFVDWSQNDAGKSTVAPYSLRGREVPTASTPVRWDEVEEVAATGDARPLTLLAGDALRRVEDGDLFSPVLVTRQRLPTLPTPP